METTTKMLIGLTILLLLLGAGSLVIASEVEGPGETQVASPEGWYYQLTYSVGTVETTLQVVSVSDKDTEATRSKNLSETEDGIASLEASIDVLAYDITQLDLGSDPAVGVNAAYTQIAEPLLHFLCYVKTSGEGCQLSFPSQMLDRSGNIVTVGSVVLKSTITQDIVAVSASGTKHWDKAVHAECVKWSEDCREAGWQSREAPVMKAG